MAPYASEDAKNLGRFRKGRFYHWWVVERDSNRLIDITADQYKEDQEILDHLHAIGEERRSILPSVIPSRPMKSKSPGMYLTTEVQGVKRDSLRIMLDLERRIFCKSTLKGSQLLERVQKFFNEERYQRKRNRVPASFFIDTYSDSTENVDRNIRRYRQKVKKLILNVAKGEFPGKY